jgi:hypothetical protein
VADPNWTSGTHRLPAEEQSHGSLQREKQGEKTKEQDKHL